MSDQTNNLALPYILPSQAQKHVPHNEARFSVWTRSSSWLSQAFNKRSARRKRSSLP